MDCCFVGHHFAKISQSGKSIDFEDGIAMIYSFVSANAEAFGHLNLVLLFGLIVFFGTFGSRLFQKLHIPQVVGGVVVGIILGGDVLKVIPHETVDSLKPFTMLALGFIGFMIGTELRGEVFKKYGKQFFIILFAQGIGAFLLVAVGASLLALFVTRNPYISISVGLVLGAIASATAPAATVNVLWEYKTRGPLTATVLAIVALDDALALILYRGAATGAKALVGTGDNSVFNTALLLLGEIIGAILLGFLAGVLLYFILKFVRDDDKILAFSISCLLLVVGISMMFGIGPILPAMTLGITIVNLARRQSKGIVGHVEKFSPPIYTSFFVLAGAHMEFDRMAPWIVAMIAVYILCRAAGKVVGSWFGARYSGAPAAVRKYLGICLLPQAGVAIGLAILAGHQFNTELGKIIIMVVMTATFLMEILGPMLVKVGVKKAGEVGLNITEEDLIKTYTVKDVMNTEPTSIAQDVPLHQILEVFSTSDSVYYPVIDKQSRIIGIITIADIKEMFANRDVAGWLLACDVAEPVLDKTTPNKPLEEAMERMRHYDVENMPVVAGDDSNELVGVLDYRMVNRKISAEVLHRRKVADEMALATS
ncbi:MAG: cation:proton antiporter domain-containing protein [Planctomycetota bacterium]